MKAIILLGIFLLSVLMADVITTKQGIVYKGKILEETPQNVTILVDGAKYPVTVLRSFIATIDRQGNGSSADGDEYTKYGDPDRIVRHRKNMTPKKSKKIGKKRKELLKLMLKYWLAKEEKKRNALIPLIKEYEIYNLKHLEKEVVSLGIFGARKGTVYDEACTVEIEGKKWTSEWSFILPPGYNPKKPSPLLIALHGGGPGVGDNDTALAKLQSHALSRNWMIIAPRIMTSRKDMWNTGISEEYVFILMQRVIEKYNVDLNRIYCAGHSMGGFGTWHYTANNTDIFAAGGAAGGGPDGADANTFPYAHYLNTPIYFIHGADDKQVLPDGDREASYYLDEWQEKPPKLEKVPKGVAKKKIKDEPYPHVYVEINGYGHGCPDQEFKKMFQFLEKYKRNLYPKRTVIYPWNINPQKKRFPRHKRNRWLEVAHKLQDYQKTFVYGEVHGNTIMIEAKECDKIAIYLHDALVDMDKPVQIFVNGEERFHSMVDRNLEFALKHMVKTKDRGRFFTSVVYLPAY